jgi:predicted RNA-binding Zn ribbon-like protein
MTEFDDVEYPVLGEPVVIEFANTLYRYGPDTTDFIGTPALAVGWFAESPTACLLERPSRLSLAMIERLRRLRDAVHLLISASIDSTVPPSEAVQVVNEHCALMLSSTTLTWSTNAGPVAQDHTSAHGFEALLGRLALDCIRLVTGPDSARLRRCASPGCPMFFLKHHSRRRWCHNSCGHRDRQSRYYQRQTILSPRKALQ